MAPSSERTRTRPAPRAAPGQPAVRNGFATAALALGLAGVTLVTIAPAVACSVLGLRRACLEGPGRIRCLAGITLSVLWAAAAGYVLPHLVQASDPGCASYKGPALTAYNKVIADFSGHGPASVRPDLSRAITALREATARSRNAVTSRDLSRLTAQLQAVLGDIQAGRVVPASALGALNTDATRADSACGTLRL